MSEAVQETQQEFWRPPSPVVAEEMVVREAIPTMAETCARCGTEFLLGSRFCHSCGGRRPEATSHAARADAAAMAGLWQQGVAQLRSVVAEFSWNKIPFPAWLRYLHFHDRLPDRHWVYCRSLAGWVAHGQDLCGLAGHPVLPCGMAAGGNRVVRGGNPAEETIRQLETNRLSCRAGVSPDPSRKDRVRPQFSV